MFAIAPTTALTDIFVEGIEHGATCPTCWIATAVLTGNCDTCD